MRDGWRTGVVVGRFQELWEHRFYGEGNTEKPFQGTKPYTGPRRLIKLSLKIMTVS